MTGEPIETRAAEAGDTIVHAHLKVVPGASRDSLAGTYGDRIKVRVRAAPESGKANKAVLSLLAATLGLPARALSLVRGAGTPLKTIAIRGRTADDVRRRLLGAKS